MTTRSTPGSLWSPFRPAEVHGVLRRHLIADGLPLCFDLESSGGSWIVDARDGRRYVDFYSFFASLPLGFRHPAFEPPEVRERLLNAALHKPANSDVESVELAAFVDTFARVAMPAPFCHLFFVEGGALAVENALKTAFDWKVRKNLAAGRPAGGSSILHFRQAFHGRSGYTLSLTNTLPIKTAHFPTFDWPRVRNPKLRFPIGEAETDRVAGEERLALEEIRQAFAERPGEIAAIIIEPIQGEGGDNHFRAEFLRALRDVAHEQEALLIFDEVQTGLGITGKLWAFQHFDVVPDIVCFGKKTQVCGLMAGPKIDEVPDNVFRVSSRLNSTWGGGLVDMVRCQVILETIEREDVLSHVVAAGEHLQGRLRELEAEFASVTNTRGRGLMCAFDCADGDQRDAVVVATREEGALALACGERSLRVRPALNIPLDVIDQGVDCLRRALARTA